MADININDRRDGDSGNSATTVLVSVVILVIIGLALYFGFARGDAAPNIPNDVNVDLNVPDVNGGAGGAGGAAE